MRAPLQTLVHNAVFPVTRSYLFLGKLITVAKSSKEDTTRQQWLTTLSSESPWLRTAYPTGNLHRSTSFTGYKAHAKTGIQSSRHTDARDDGNYARKGKVIRELDTFKARAFSK